MAGKRPAPAAILLVLLAAAFAPISSAVRPVSDAHRSAAAELFAPSADGSFGDLESTYEAVRTFQILGLENYKSLSGKACKFAAENLASPGSTAKDLFHAVRISGVLGCGVDARVYDGVVAKLKAVIKDTNSLLEFYYSVGGLLSIKEQGHNVVLSDAESTFHAIKALSQSDGRWRYDTNSAESSTFAAGIALEALAGIVSLADAEVDPSMVGVVKNDIVKLFDTIKSYDDGTFYFDEKHVDATEYKGPIKTSASVLRGVTSFAAVVSGKLNIPAEKILGLAKFFLGIGLPGSAKDCFNQIESLSFLENNRVFVPLILSLPSKVFSLTSKDQLKEVALPVLEQLLMEWLLAQPCYLLFRLPPEAAQVATRRPPGLALPGCAATWRVLVAARAPTSCSTFWGSSSRRRPHGTWAATTATGAALTSYFVHEVAHPVLNQPVRLAGSYRCWFVKKYCWLVCVRKILFRLEIYDRL